MTLIENVHYAVANCGSLIGDKAASTGAWANHTVQSYGGQVLNGAKIFGSGILHLMQKCAQFGKALASGAYMYGSAGWQMTKYAGGKGWEIAKICGNYGIQALSRIVCLARSILGSLGTAIGTGLRALALKIAQLGALLKSGLSSGADGAYRGLQNARAFAVGHPVEIALAGAALAIFSLGYAVGRYVQPETANA